MDVPPESFTLAVKAENSAIKRVLSKRKFNNRKITMKIVLTTVAKLSLIVGCQLVSSAALENRERMRVQAGLGCIFVLAINAIMKWRLKASQMDGACVQLEAFRGCN